MRRIDRRNNPRKAHVRHILLANKPQAREILEQIQNSKKPLKEFKKLAKKFSNCPSGSKKRRPRNLDRRRSDGTRF